MEEFGFGNSKTTIQRELLLRNFTGKTIDITCFIGDIKNDSIEIGDLLWGNSYTSHSFQLKLFYEKEKFNNQLLAFTYGDEDKINAKLKSVDLRNSSLPHYEFDLVSIAKTGATYQSINNDRIKERKQKTKAENKNSSCFIATVCYGNFDAPEVLILRQYRDNKLLKNYFGKLFVAFYYLTSPFCAEIIAQSNFLKKIVRKYFLGPIVTNLKRQKLKDKIPIADSLARRTATQDKETLLPTARFCVSGGDE